MIVCTKCEVENGCECDTANEYEYKVEFFSANGSLLAKKVIVSKADDEESAWNRVDSLADHMAAYEEDLENAEEYEVSLIDVH